MAYQVRQFLNHRCLMVFNPALSGVRMPLIRNHIPVPDSGTGVQLWEKVAVGTVDPEYAHNDRRYGVSPAMSYLGDLTALQGNGTVKPPLVGE